MQLITCSKPYFILTTLIRITNLGTVLRNGEKVGRYDFYLCRTSDEVMHILGNILGSLQRGRTSLIVPRKRAIDDLMRSRNMVGYEREIRLSKSN